MQDTQAALKTINEMQEAGVIGSYAIGGAVAATFYIEPTATYDIDIFISFRNVPKSSIVSLEPIYTYLKSRGYGVEDEHIVIENWQIQFLPADDNLYSEALQQAVEINLGEIKTRVMTAEHLMVIALRTGRGKDLIRLEQFVQDKAFNQTRLDEILSRHNLVAKWKQFHDKYIEGDK